MKHYLPASLDVDTLISELPTIDIDNFKKNHLLYILHLVSSIPAANKKLELKDGFVPITAKLLQIRIRNYRQYLDYLIRTNVLITDNQYIKGHKSKGYKFSDHCSGLVTPVEDGSKKKTGRNTNTLSNENRIDYKHLLKWYQELQIDEVTAKNFIKQDWERKQAAAVLVKKSTKELYLKDADTQYNQSLINIEKLADGNCGVIVDDNVFRLHSCLTNIKSELRNLITWDGTPLVSVDIKNSQPFLSTIVLNARFWLDDNHNSNGILRIKDLEKNFVSKIFKKNSFDSFIRLSKETETNIDSDVHKYKRLVEEGSFYDYVAEYILTTCKTPKDSMKIKEAIFQVLFTDNRFYGQEKAACKRVFKEHFPTVYKLFALIKQRDKTSLPVLLQRIESYLILKVITKRIAREKARLPIFTIHDSVVTTAGNELHVRRIIIEELNKAVGIAPSFSIDQWAIENLHFMDGSRYVDSLVPDNVLNDVAKPAFAK